MLKSMEFKIMIKILVVNVGSTSLKYQLIDMSDESILVRGKVERVGKENALLTHYSAGRKKIVKQLNIPDQAAAIKLMTDLLLDADTGALKDLSEVSAVGFKTVHAGTISGSVLITETVLKALEEYTFAAPAHNKPYIEAIRNFQKLLPNISLAAVFETSFHKEIPDYAYMYSCPYEWLRKYNIRKFGFHGASHCYVSERAAQITGRPLDKLKIISCHLGGSSSICAIRNGKSVDTSMGFSPQSGLPMSTRCGDLDPFAVLYVMKKENLTIDQARDILVKKSGLLGISGISSDLRDIEEQAANGSSRAGLALDMFIYEARKYIGAYTAVLEGVDVIAFTGGIGENNINIRQRICKGLEFLGIIVDPERNNIKAKEAVVSPESAVIKVMVIPANEELVVARETLNVIKENKKKL